MQDFILQNDRRTRVPAGWLILQNDRRTQVLAGWSILQSDRTQVFAGWLILQRDHKNLQDDWFCRMITANIITRYRTTIAVFRKSCQHSYKVRHYTYLVPYLRKGVEKQKVGTMVQKATNHQMPQRPTRYFTSVFAGSQKIPFKVKTKTA